MVLLIPAVDLYWGRCGRLLRCGSLLGTMLKRMTQYISTGAVLKDMALYISTGYGRNRTVDLYWGRSSKIWCRRYLLGTVR